MDYLLKVNIALILFYIFYKLFLSSDTFFTWRRFTLLLIIMISIMFPLVDLSEWIHIQKSISNLSVIYSNVMPEFIIEANGIVTNSKISDYISLGVLIAYWLIVFVLLFRFVIQLVSIVVLCCKCKTSIIGSTEVFLLDKEFAPFSFFKWIFINPKSLTDKEIPEVISHELAHVHQWHSVDVLLGELICIFLWYNPFVWFLKGEIRNNLEYLADNEVLHEGFDSKKYQYHLLGLTYKPAAAKLYNNFNVLHLKKRIKMMNKERTKKIGKAKYLLLLPMVAVMIVCSNLEALAINKSMSSMGEINNETETESKVYKVVDVMPEFPGGMDAFSKWLSANLTYPAQAMEKGIHGVVVARFVVKADGSIGTVELLKKVHPLLDAEAERVLKTLPKFKPGMSGGKAVNVYFSIPLTFALTKESAKTITITP